MTDEQKVSLTMTQHLAVLVAYQGLASDLRKGTDFSPPLKDLNRILKQSFKNKKEAFAFIHDMLEYNGEETLNICGMGDCPAIAKNGIADRSVGKYTVAWMSDIGAVEDKRRLCQDCKDYLVEKQMINGDEEQDDRDSQKTEE